MARNQPTSDCFYADGVRVGLVPSTHVVADRATPEVADAHSTRSAAASLPLSAWSTCRSMWSKASISTAGTILLDRHQHHFRGRPQVRRQAVSTVNGLLRMNSRSGVPIT
jgi:hypothetical protein